MPLPIIPIILGIAGTALGAVGIKKASSGFKKKKDAKKIYDDSISKYESYKERLETKKEETNELGIKYGEFQFEVIDKVVNRLISFMNQNDINFSNSEKKIFKEVGVEISSPNNSEPEIKKVDIAKGTVSSISAASAGFYGVSSAAVSFGTASTGAAISGLTGASATKATLAFLGGGSLAAGGGGMLLGKIILGGVSLGAAIFVGGLAFDGAAEKMKTKAKEVEADVDVACENINSLIAFLGGVDSRISELIAVSTELFEKSTNSLDKIEKLEFDKNNMSHVREFQEAMILITSLIQVINTPVLDESGSLTSESGVIVEKYKAA